MYGLRLKETQSFYYMSVTFSEPLRLGAFVANNHFS